MDLEPIILEIIKYGDNALALEILSAFYEEADSFEGYENITKCYASIGEFSLSLESGKKALQYADKEQSKIFKENMVSIARRAARPEFALQLIEQMSPNAILDIEKAGALYELDRKLDSLHVLENVDSKKLSVYHKAKLQNYLGNCYLYFSDFKQGLRQVIIDGSKVRELESPIPDQFHSRKELPLPFWDGTAKVKNLIIYAEAGIGDEIINIRFMKHLEDRGINAVWYGVWHDNAKVNKREGVVKVFQNSGFKVVTNLNELGDPKEWMWTYSQYLPINLKLDTQDLWYGNYLKSDGNTYVKKLSDKTNVGIRWYGNPNPAYRNYPLKELYGAIGDADAIFYSLQKDEGLDELKDFPGIINPQLGDFEDTVSYINSMDIIITSCTCIAHAAAALGKETYILVPISAYYVWCCTDDSPWYGSNVKILRQTTPRSWKEPIAKLRSILLEKKIIHE